MEGYPGLTVATLPRMRIGAPLNSEPTPILQWIEVASSLHIPNFYIIGLPAPEVSEARERVRAAIESSGLEFPRRRVVVNLSPASVRKRGTGLDLAMALSILSTTSEVKLPDSLDSLVAWGELGLNGEVKPAGQLVRTLFASWSEGIRTVILAEGEYPQALAALALITKSGEAFGPPPRLIPVSHLTEAWEQFQNSRAVVKPVPLSAVEESVPGTKKSERDGLLPLSPLLERLVSISAAGAHHLLLLGPRGSGKSHAMEWLIGLQPDASPSVRFRHALLAELGGSGSVTQENAPIRRVGVHTRPAALIGNATATSLRPGEFSLAHGGLLVADELPEWPRDSRESLREPLERGLVTLTRAEGALEFAARFTFAANGNLCPCGGLPPSLPRDLNRPSGAASPCVCAPSARKEYLARLSGPVLDRIDLVSLILSPVQEMSNADSASEQFERLRKKVAQAHGQALKLWGCPSGQLRASQIDQFLKDHPEWRQKWDPTTSLRTRHKLTRVALTIALLEGEREPKEEHFAEAWCYRPTVFSGARPWHG